MPDTFNYFNWRHRAREFPCSFAKTIVGSLGPGAVLFREALGANPVEIATQINETVEGAIRAPARVLAIHVPAWSERLMAETLVALGALDDWSLTVHPALKIGGSDLLRIGVHRTLRAARVDELAVETVPMALGPFANFPASRMCPAPILEMTVDANCVGQKPRNGKRRADFLALPTPKLNDQQREKQKRVVKDRTRRLNNGVDPRAHPNVTATVSVELATLFKL